MDNQEGRNKNAHDLYHGRYLLWTLHFLFSIFLLSLFLSYITGLSFIRSYGYHFSAFFLPFITRLLERNYMFLLCNGLILIFLLRIRSSDYHNFNDLFRYTDLDSEIIRKSYQDVKYHHVTEKPLVEEEEETVEVEVNGSSSRSEAEPYYCYEVDVDESSKKDESVQEGTEDDDKYFVQESDAEVQEEGGETMVNDCDRFSEGGVDEIEEEQTISIPDDELNRKIEEFISRMRKELRLESLQEQPLIPA